MYSSQRFTKSVAKQKMWKSFQPWDNSKKYKYKGGFWSQSWSNLSQYFKGICLFNTQVCVLSHSVVFSSLQTYRLQPTRLLCPWNYPGKKTGMGCHAFPQGIFPTQGLKPGLLNYRRILDHLSYQGSPVQVSGYKTVLLGQIQSVFLFY